MSRPEPDIGSPLRVLHAGKFFPPHAGGIERFSADLISALADQGHPQAAVIHATPGNARAQRAWQPATNVWIRETPCAGRLMFTPVSPRWPIDLRRLLRDFQPDLLHIHAPNPSAFWLLGMPSARRLPWVVQWHADVPMDAEHRGLRLAYPAYRQLERRLLARASVIVPSTHSYMQASTALLAHRARCQVIPLGIAENSDEDLARVSQQPELPWPADGLRLLAVGRLSYYKGFGVLLEAIAKVRGVSLLLVGEGEQRAFLQQQLERLGLQSRVKLLGQVDDPTLLAAYRQCDALCLPSLDRSEAFGMVLLEAMRAGRATIVSAVPGSGMSEVVADDQTGLHVPPGDVDALAAALQRLETDRNMVKRLGDAGRMRWLQHYQLKAVSHRWIELYRSVLRHPQSD